jgi:hypothetical protein
LLVESLFRPVIRLTLDELVAAEVGTPVGANWLMSTATLAKNLKSHFWDEDTGEQLWA